MSPFEVHELAFQPAENGCTVITINGKTLPPLTMSELLLITTEVSRAYVRSLREVAPPPNNPLTS